MKRDIFWVFAARGVSAVFQAVSMVILARTIPLSTFGIIATIVTLSLFVNTAADFGLSTLAAREAGRSNRALVMDCTRASFITGTYLSVVVAGVGVVLTCAGLMDFWLLVLMIALSLEKHIEYLAALLIAERRPVASGVSLLLRRCATTVLVLTGWWLGSQNAAPYAVGYFLGVLSAGVYMFIVRNGDLWGHANRSLRETLSTSRPFLVSNLSAHVRYLDVTLVAVVASSHQTALYAAAGRLLQPLLLLPQALTSVLMPHSATQSPRGLKSISRRLYLWTAILLALGLVAASFAEWAIVLLFGDQFVGAGASLAWMLLAVPMIGLSSQLGVILQVLGLQRFVAVNGVGMALLFVPVVLVFAFFGGAAGGAMGLFLVYALKSLMLLVRVERAHGRHT